MILYYSPGACSLVAHIALEESGSPFEAIRVTIAKGEHLTEHFLRISRHGRVPALGTENGVITENIAILNLLAALRSADGSVPLEDPFRAARCNELLGWFASSVHISFAQLWRAERFTSDQSLHAGIQAGGREMLNRQFAEIEDLCSDEWIVPGSFTAADSYLLTFFRWGRRIGEDMARFPRWSALIERVLERPAVRRALAREGLEVTEFRLPS